METTKCPSCRAIIPALTNICEYCDTRIEKSANLDGSSDKPTLDSAIHVLEHDIMKLKSIPAPSIGKYLKVAIFTYFTFGLYLLFRKIKSNKIDSFETLESIASKNARNLRTYYGDDPKVKVLILELEQEIKDVKQLRTTKSRNTNIGCLSIVVIFVVLFFGLAKLGDSIIEEEIKNYNQQIEKIEQNFNVIENLILSERYDEAVIQLTDISWVPVYELVYGGYDKPKKLDSQDQQMRDKYEKKKQELLDMINKKRSERR